MRSGDNNDLRAADAISEAAAILVEIQKNGPVEYTQRYPPPSSRRRGTA